MNESPTLSQKSIGFNLNKLISFVAELSSKKSETPWYLTDKTIPSLNGWRAVAILFVIYAHCYFSLGFGLNHMGVLGVQIFFILSGFLITTLLIKEKIKNNTISLRNFFIRRFFRLFPVLWVYLIVIYILYWQGIIAIQPANFIGPILYLSNFNFFPGSWIMGHTWSLAVEEQYYILWPLAFVKLKKPLIFLLTFILISPFIKVLGYEVPALKNWILEPFIKYAFFIFLGSLLSYVSFKGIFNTLNTKLIFHPLIILVVVALIYSSSYFQGHGMLAKLMLPAGDSIIGVGLCYLILFTVMQRKNYFYKLLNSRLLIQIGIMSYSIYLWQQLFLHPAGTYVKLDPYFYFPVYLLEIAIASTLSFYCIERYFLKLKTKFSV